MTHRPAISISSCLAAPSSRWKCCRTPSLPNMAGSRPASRRSVPSAARTSGSQTQQPRPGFGKGFAFVSKFEPRLSISGPLKRDRLLLGQYFQYRFARTRVKSLPGEPQIGLDSFDSFTRLDAVLSSRHALTGGVIYFPRKITNATLSTFRPEETTPKFTQSGFSAGLVEWLILSAYCGPRIDRRGAHIRGRSEDPGDAADDLSPAGASGNFFNRQERNVRSLQVVEALTLSKDDWLGQHVFKVGIDLQHSRFDGDNYSQELDVVRLDGSLAERTTYSPAHDQPRGQRHRNRRLRQDRWRVNDRLTFEFGIRADRDDVVERVNYSPRVGRGREPVARGPGNPPWRLWQVRGTYAAERRRLRAVQSADRQPVRRRRHAARRARDLRPCRRWFAEDPGEHRPDRRLGPAIRPSLVLQDGLPSSQRIARLHRRAGNEPRPADARSSRRIEVLGVRNNRPISRERASRSERVVCQVARHARSQRLRPVLWQLQESHHPVERERAQSDRRTQPADRSWYDRPACQWVFVAVL